MKLRHSIPALFLVTLPAVAQAQTLEWESGFEEGFPGEWLNYNQEEGPFEASGQSNDVHYWTIVDKSDPVTLFGEHSYKGVVTGENDTAHRPYPVVHLDNLDLDGPVVNTFWTYLDVDYENLADNQWIQLGTWAVDEAWQQIMTMSVRARTIEMAHVDWSWIGPDPQPDFPLRQWVRFTVYFDYRNDGTYVRVWQDGVPVIEGTDSDVAPSLLRAHWGWYSPGSISTGAQYNDNIRVWSLDAPLEDLEADPDPDVEQNPDPGGNGGSGGGGSEGGSSNNGSGGESSGGNQGSGGSSGSGTSSGGSSSTSGGSSSSGGTGTSSGGSSQSSGGTTPKSAEGESSAEDDGGGCSVGTKRSTPARDFGVMLVGAVLALGRLRRRSRR